MHLACNKVFELGNFHAPKKVFGVQHVWARNVNFRARKFANSNKVLGVQNVARRNV
jgi:hypothetical protein